VRILPHRGAVVSELSPSEVEEIFELRAVLEPRLLKHSAPRLTKEDYGALRSTLAEFDTELRAGHVGRWGELNKAFHLRLYARADRPRTSGLVATLLQEADRHTRLQLSYTDGRRGLSASMPRFWTFARPVRSATRVRSFDPTSRTSAIR
jgi:DNA-binding GntR family transcriptional regulator